MSRFSFRGLISCFPNSIPPLSRTLDFGLRVQFRLLLLFTCPLALPPPDGWEGAGAEYERVDGVLFTGGE